MKMKFGAIIASRRRELGLNQVELASRLTARGLSVSNQAVSKWENGADAAQCRSTFWF